MTTKQLDLLVFGNYFELDGVRIDPMNVSITKPKGEITVDLTVDELIKLRDKAERMADMARSEWGLCNEYYIQTRKVEYYKSMIYAKEVNRA